MRSFPPRPLAGRLALLAVGAVTATLLAAPPVHAQTTSDEGVPSGSGSSDTGTDTEIADAIEAAANTGENVEIESLATPESEVYATPDGTFLEEVALEPYQAQASDGTWADIDNTLVASSEGTLVPTLNDTGLELSNGGDSVLARITDVHGRSVTYTWHETLPTPTVDGDTAIYAEVIPGVDLKVKATNDGFAKVFEVKTPEAAASPDVASIQLGVELDGFNAAVSETGAFEISDYAGNVLHTGPTPTMWDATPPSESVDDSTSAEWSPSTFAMTADVGMNYSAGTLTLTPDPTMLASSNAVYPLRIDPKQVSVARSAWAMVSDYSSYRNRSYYNGGSFETDPKGTARVGRAWDDYQGDMEQTWRLAFEFDTDKFRGRDIIEADLRLTMTYSWMYACDGQSVSADIHELDVDNLRKWTWNDQGTWGSKIASRDEGVSPSCPAPRQLWTDVTDYVSDAADSNDGRIQFGLKASSETCGEHCPGFRRFGPEKTKDKNGGVYLRVRYNTPPNRPGSFTIDGQSCTSGSTVKLGAAASWTVSAKVSDADGDNMDAVMKWVDQDSGASKHWTTSGANRERTFWTVHDDDVTGQTYEATVSAKDSRTTGASAGGCTVLVDTTPPEPPTVDSTDYPECTQSDPDTCAPHGSVGKTGRFTLQSVSDDTAGYYWSLQDAVGDNTVPVSTLGGGTTIAFDPPTSGTLTLSAWAYDEHGNTSDKTTYVLRVNDAVDPIAHWKLDEMEGATAADTAYPEYDGDLDRPLTLDGPEWTGGNAADAANDHLDYLTFDDSDEAATSAPVLQTNSSYTVSAWVRIHQTDIDYTIASQDGNVNSAFMLKYDGESHEFLIVASNQDSTQSGLDFPSAGSEVDVQAGVWYHVTGVFAYSDQELRIYVNGQLQNTAPFSDSWDANGSFILGRDLYGGNETTHFAGDIDEVKIWDRIVSTGEISRLGQHAEGIWDFEGISYDDFEDLSGGGNHLNGSDIELIEGYNGQGAGFNGSTSTATTNGPVLDTTGDFTIAAWVRLERDDGLANVISQDGTEMSPFFLGYNASRDKWGFRAPTADDGADYGWKTVYAPGDPQIGEWTHLAAVHQASTGTVSLYVNGEPAIQESGFDLWAADGPLRVGAFLQHGTVTDHWPGAIDSVNVNTGTFDDQQIEALADISERETHSQMLTGHFNGDAYLDALAIVEEDDEYSDIYLLAGDAEGGFTRTTDPVFESDMLNLLEQRNWHLDDAIWRSGDVNGDGRDDLVLAVPGSDSFEVWALTACGPRDRICTSSGTLFVQSGIKNLTLSGADGWMMSDTDIQLGDVTGDQRDDLVMLRGDGLDTYSIWRSEFNMRQFGSAFNAPVQVATGTGDSRTVELAVADFDGDWWGDIAEIRTDAAGTVDVYLRYGSTSGLGSPVMKLDAGGGWVEDRGRTTIADVTGDGLPDLVNSYRFTNRVRLQIAESNSDRGDFSKVNWDYSAPCTGCATDLTRWPFVRLGGGDVNRDGVDDLITLRSGVGGDIGAMWTRLSDGSGFISKHPSWADPTTCFGVEGDVNGDGYPDAVVPYPTFDLDGLSDVGAIRFIDGATGQVSIVHEGSDGIVGAAEAGDRFGFSTDLYDSNGDGCSDIVVGVPGENGSVGSSVTLPGSPEGLDTSADYWLSQSATGVPGASESGDQFGYSVAATNRIDGTPVVAYGIPGEDVQTDTTGAYRDGDTRVSEVVDGGAFVYIQGDSKAWVDQDTPGVGGAVEQGDQFGWSIDLTPTRFMVGAPFEDTVSNTASDAGGALVFDHDTSPEGWPNYLAWLDQEDSYIPGGAESGDRLGYAVSAVDYWPEGEGPWVSETRFAIGTPWEDAAGGLPENTGVVTLVNLDRNGVFTLAKQYAQQEAGLGDVWEDYDHLGRTLALVDLDQTRESSNTTLKLVIGAPDEDFSTGDDDGLVHVTGAAAPADGIDTMITYSPPDSNGKFGAGFGCTAGTLYIAAPGTGGLYSFDWSAASGGSTLTADTVT